MKIYFLPVSRILENIFLLINKMELIYHRLDNKKLISRKYFVRDIIPITSYYENLVIKEKILEIYQIFIINIGFIKYYKHKYPSLIFDQSTINNAAMYNNINFVKYL